MTAEFFFSEMLGSKIKLLAGLISPGAFLSGLWKAASGQTPMAVPFVQAFLVTLLSPARTSVILNEDSTPMTLTTSFNLHSFLKDLFLNAVTWQGSGGDLIQATVGFKHTLCP